MIKVIRLVFISIVGFFLSCETPVNKVVLKDNEVATIDTMLVLEISNSDKFLFKETASYEEVLNSGNLIEYDRITNEEYLHKFENPKADSVFFHLRNDTVYVSHVFFIRGRCGYEEFAYLKFADNNAYLKAPMLTNGTLKIVKKDTIISNTIGADCAGAIEQRFKIPVSKLLNVEHLYFGAREIKFKKLGNYSN